MTNDEIKASSERLRMWDAGIPPSKIYGVGVDPIEAADNDAWDLAREFRKRLAYDEQHAKREESLALAEARNKACHDIIDLFNWCVQNLSEFPPIEGEWLDDVKRRLASDEQQASEDAEPISREWFNENGNDVSSIIVCRDNVEYEIEAACGEPSVGIDLTLNVDGKLQGIMTLRHITTCGQLRRLLKALRGGA